MSTAEQKAKNAAAQRRFRERNPERARQHCRDYYARNAATINFRQKLRDCGIDPRSVT